MSRFMTKDGTLRKRSEDVRQEGYQRQVETMAWEMLDRGASIAEVARSLQCIVGTAIESVRDERWKEEVRAELRQRIADIEAENYELPNPWKT